MKIVIIDYGAGNVESVANALRQVGVGDEIVVSGKISDIKSAHRLILPGVGAFGDCMNGLNSVEGLLFEIKNQALIEKKPFLGICVGMQVMAVVGYENGQHQGLGFIDGRVEKIAAQDGLKIPHMGWNEIKIKSQHPVLSGISDGEHFYFANSYHFVCQNENSALAQVEYGSQMNVVVAKNNIVGVQFHPEKSGVAGLKLLKNFLNWRP
jgi:glutamine amidotransferase